MALGISDWTSGRLKSAHRLQLFLSLSLPFAVASASYSGMLGDECDFPDLRSQLDSQDLVRVHQTQWVECQLELAHSVNTVGAELFNQTVPLFEPDPMLSRDSP